MSIFPKRPLQKVKPAPKAAAKPESRASSLEGMKMPSTGAPKWRNPTAYVLARRARDGTLTPIKGISDLSLEQLPEVASALIGSTYMVLRRLFEEQQSALRILLQDDVALHQEMLARGEKIKKCEPKVVVEEIAEPVKKTKRKKS